jgi:hypothetical protein
LPIFVKFVINSIKFDQNSYEILLGFEYKVSTAGSAVSVWGMIGFLKLTMLCVSTGMLSTKQAFS